MGKNIGSDCFPCNKSYEWESYPTWTPDESPVFSPDGSKIAFLSIEGDPVNGSGAVSVKSINPDGSNLTQLASVRTYGSSAPYIRLPRSVSLCWSPDGTKFSLLQILKKMAVIFLLLTQMVQV